MPAIVGSCPVCGVRDLNEDDKVMCAYCEFFAVPEAIKSLEDARRLHKARDPQALEIAAKVRDLSMERIDLMDRKTYGGDVDTLVHLIDFEAVA